MAGHFAPYCPVQFLGSISLLPRVKFPHSSNERLTLIDSCLIWQLSKPALYDVRPRGRDTESSLTSRRAIVLLLTDIRRDCDFRVSMRIQLMPDSQDIQWIRCAQSRSWILYVGNVCAASSSFNGLLWPADAYEKSLHMSTLKDSTAVAHYCEPCVYMPEPFITIE